MQDASVRRPLDDEQMRNLLENIKHIVCCLQDGNEHERVAAAQEFEERIATYLDDTGAKYRTESQLRMQQEEHGGLTPDFLLDEPIKINGHEVNWIECKCYYASTIPRLVKRMRYIKTARKYQKAFGNGLMVFAYGFNKDLEPVEGVLFCAVER